MKLLADTSALLAVVLRDDKHHRAAAAFVKSHPSARFILTELVVAELATRLRARVGAERAVGVVRELLKSRRYELVFTDSTVIDAALERMERFEDKRLSLPDCASMVLIDRLRLAGAFTFDDDFRKCGVRSLP
jgi:predicted nucleic acid-binding protein